MKAAHRSTAMLIVLALAACSAGQEEAPPPPVEDTVFGDMVGTMDKARDVETTTLQHKEDLDRALEAAEGQE